MKRDDKFQLVNELSKAVTDKTVYEHALGTERLEFHANTNTLKINGNVGLQQEEKQVDEKQLEEEIFAKLYQQRKS